MSGIYSSTVPVDESTNATGYAAVGYATFCTAIGGLTSNQKLEMLDNVIELAQIAKRRVRDGNAASDVASAFTSNYPSANPGPDDITPTLEVGYAKHEVTVAFVNVLKCILRA